LLQLFVWYGWFCYLVYIVPFSGIEVFHGDARPEVPESNPAKRAYDNGRRLVSQALVLNSLVSLLSSWVIGALMKRVNIRYLYTIMILFQSILFILMISVKSPITLWITIACLGVPWSATLIIPYSIAGQLASGSTNAGFLMSTLNIAICIPQIVLSLSSGAIISKSSWRYSMVFAVGAVVELIGAILCFAILRTNQKTNRREESYY
jgi:solute carrier family 45 protein 1/2/4